jgi:hypothetical protein
MKKRILIKTYGFIGDILFASSIAKKLKEQEDCSVDYCIGFPQPYKLLKNNPHIDNVYLSSVKGPRVQLPSSIQESTYDMVYELPECRQDVQPTIWYQQYCGVKNPTSEYQIFTDETLDQSVAYELNLLNPKKVKVIGFVANWKQLTVVYNEQEYVSGLKHAEKIMQHSQPNTRDIDRILQELNEEHIIIPLGYETGVTQYYTALDSTATYTNTASVAKMCDLVVGQEGGMTNLAAGVGTKCVITTDFMHALYGPCGIMKRYANVMLGPKNILPNGNHVHVSPFATDDELLNTIKNEI